MKTKIQDTNHWAGNLPYPMAHKNIKVKKINEERIISKTRSANVQFK